MGKALTLRDDYDAVSLRLLARKAKDSRVARRLLALAGVYDGMDRSAAAKAGGMDRQSLRDWVIAFNANGPDGLRDGKRSGAPSKLNAARQAKLKEIVLAGPDPEVDHVVRWRCLDLQAVIQRAFDIKVSQVTVGRLLHRLGFSHVSTRPRHPGQKIEAIATFKKTLRWRSVVP
jgi:transposase